MNRVIASKYAVDAMDTPLATARAIKGLRAMFGKCGGGGERGGGGEAARLGVCVVARINGSQKRGRAGETYPDPVRVIAVGPKVGARVPVLDLCWARGCVTFQDWRLDCGCVGQPERRRCSRL